MTQTQRAETPSSSIPTYRGPIRDLERDFFQVRVIIGQVGMALS